MIRPATLEDLDDLIAIEDACFDTDRLSRRNFKYLLTKGNAETLLDEERGHLRGYAMILFNEGTSLARLYSIAVHPKHQGKGVAKALLKAAEKVAVEQDCITMRLEIREDNKRGIHVYKKAGYREFGNYTDYYEDHMDALRFEKRLKPLKKPELGKIPFFEQTTEFTCGPAALLMAMRTLDDKISLSRKNELRLWRESTTIFMTSGHGGCDPFGLALAAFRRGFAVEVWVVTKEGALFIDSVRSPEKKEVMRIVQEDFIEQTKKTTIELHRGTLSVEGIQQKFEQGGIPLVLISSYRIYREKFPHWVVVTGFDEKYIYVHDPYVDVEQNKTVTDCVNMPIVKKDFARMARYGKAGQKAVLILYRKKESE